MGNEVAFEQACLVVDVSVGLPPAQVIPQGAVRWVADSSAIKDWHVLQLLGREEACPAVHIMCSEATDNQ